MIWSSEGVFRMLTQSLCIPGQSPLAHILYQGPKPCDFSLAKCPDVFQFQEQDTRQVLSESNHPRVDSRQFTLKLNDACLQCLLHGFRRQIAEEGDCHRKEWILWQRLRKEFSQPLHKAVLSCVGELVDSSFGAVPFPTDLCRCNEARLDQTINGMIQRALGA